MYKITLCGIDFPDLAWGLTREGIVYMEQSFYVFSHCPSGIKWQAGAK